MRACEPSGRRTLRRIAARGQGIGTTAQTRTASKVSISNERQYLTDRNYVVYNTRAVFKGNWRPRESLNGLSSTFHLGRHRPTKSIMSQVGCPCCNRAKKQHEEIKIREESILSVSANIEGSFNQRGKDYVHGNVKTDKRSFKQSIEDAI